MFSGFSDDTHRFHRSTKHRRLHPLRKQAAIVVSVEWQVANRRVYFSGVMRSVNCCGVLGTQYDLRVSTPPHEALPTPR